MPGGGLASNNPAKLKRDVTITQARLQGLSYRKIAQKYKVDLATISRVLNREEIKEILEVGTNQLLSFVPLAINNYLRFLTDQSDTNHYKANRDVLQTVGILASHTGGNTYIQQHLTLNSQVIDSAAVDKLANLMGSQRQIEVIDADYETLDDSVSD